MKPRNLAANPPPKLAPPVAHPLRNAALQTAGLILLSVVALSFCFAPASQIYLAWVGLAPLLLAVRNLPSQRSAFLWGWGGGILFFAANMWWLAHVTLAGTAALVVYLGLFWAIAAVLVRGCALLGRWNQSNGQALPPLRPIRCALLIAAMWCGLEWLRGSYSPIGAHGLPLLYLGDSQTPLLAGCQIADITGVYGVSFWIVLMNALAAMLWIDRANLSRLRNAMLLVAGVMIAVMGYGIFRLRQGTARPGPAVMVVQSNYPQSNTGQKGASLDQIVDFHVNMTDSALASCQARGQKVDLVVWSETSMPPLNQEARDYNRGVALGDFIEQTSQRISELAVRYRTSFLVGSTYAADWQWVAGAESAEPQDRRNSAYLFGPTGKLEPQRYDKIQLLPFGEFVPYRDSIPRLYQRLVSLGPEDMKCYQLEPGAPEALTVFQLDRAGPGGVTQAWRFVVPICFEDIVAPLVTGLLWGAEGKRADFLVNLTNDGWFPASEGAQHLQDATFRSIEHRVPAARSVNTGISGFIDSDGRISDTVPSGTEGWVVRQLQLDNRTTLYSRFGDAFAKLCALVSLGIVIYGITSAVKNRRSDAFLGET